MNKLIPMHKLVIGKKYNVHKDKNATVEAIGRGDGLICVRWDCGKLQLVRGDILSDFII